MASSMAPFWRPSLATLNSLSSPSTAHSTLSASNGDVIENTVIVRSGSVHSKRSSGCRFTFPAVPQQRRRKVVTVAKMDPKSGSRSAPYFIALSFLPIVAFFGTVIFLTYYAEPVSNATPVNLAPARKNLTPLKTRTAAKTLGLAKQRAKALRLGILEEPQSRPQRPVIFPRAYPEGRVERLSKSIIPLIYNLDLDVYLPYRYNLDFGSKNFTIDGRLHMIFRCDGPKVDTVRLHAMNLTLDWKSLKVMDMDNGTQREVEIKTFEHSEATTILKLVLKDQLENGRNYSLSIRYSAKVNSRAEDCGMFRSFYFVGQEKRYLAVTHLQPFYARRLFPCIDQPDFKAKFHLTVRHPQGTNVVSNTRLRHFTQIRRDWSESRFEPTPKMSTYLLAIAVSDYPSKETRYKQHKIRAWVQPAMVNELDYALQVTVKALGFFEDYFGIPYPLTKLDIFGVPYLAVEAMENWGLLMFRQQHIVYSSALHSVSNRRRLTDTLMHEIGHMWFGNLVTMEWWNDLWLNEGFATMMSAKAADFVENTTARHDELFFDSMRNIMHRDQNRINQPLSHATDTFPGIRSTFGAFTYWKGSAIVRMFEKTIGPKIFRVGIRKYLREFSYGSTNAMDLLTTLDGVVAETASQKIAGGIWENFTIVDYMNTWVLQPGFPLVQIARPNNSLPSWEVFVSQKLFMTSVTPLSKAAIRWKVPLFKEEGEGLTWLEHENMTLTLPPGKLIDPGSFGYYRVAYDAQSYEHFIRILHEDHTKLPLTARFRLLEDSFILARMERLPYSTVFRMCEYLAKETEYMPFYVFTIHMQKLHHLLLNHKDEIQIQEFITRLLKPAYDRAFSADPRNDAVEIMQELTMSQLCMWNHEPCLQKALTIFADLKKSCASSALSNASCNNIFPALRETVYTTSIAHGSTDDFMFVKEKFLIENDDVERDRVKTALAITPNISLFDHILWDSIIKLGDVSSMESVKDFLQKSFSRTSIHEQLIRYMRINFKSLIYRTRYPAILNTLLSSMMYYLHTDKDFAEFEAFIKDHPAELGGMSTSPLFIQYINQAKDQARFIEERGTAILENLRELNGRKIFVVQ
ncbi:peptidase family m1 domain-containing protein [Ditylenchus destructor]|uniref:Peptidase family m1 domain-containing protein n=1 Tax=Ditylenchus destructor TaxID=166010 RepID=A0AAD4MUR9_9BILA|nr:peptidase family m1 domain-containing protein [Ditylenchus destructor]